MTHVSMVFVSGLGHSSFITESTDLPIVDSHRMLRFQLDTPHSSHINGNSPANRLPSLKYDPLIFPKALVRGPYRKFIHPLLVYGSQRLHLGLSGDP